MIENQLRHCLGNPKGICFSRLSYCLFVFIRYLVVLAKIGRGVNRIESEKEYK